jgi:hypothetical protein
MDAAEYPCTPWNNSVGMDNESRADVDETQGKGKKEEGRGSAGRCMLDMCRHRSSRHWQFKAGAKYHTTHRAAENIAKRMAKFLVCTDEDGNGTSYYNKLFDGKPQLFLCCSLLVVIASLPFAMVWSAKRRIQSLHSHQLLYRERRAADVTSFHPIQLQCNR